MPWAFFLTSSLWINSLVTFLLLVSIELSIKSKISENINDLKYGVDCLFVMSEKEVFPGRSFFFINVRYDNGREKKFFLVENLERKWVIMDRNRNICGDYIFDMLIDEKDSVFTMRSNNNMYYVYLNGEKPRINLRIA